MLKTAMGIAALFVAAPLAAAAPVDGRWFTQDKSGVVSVGACGPSRCGKLVKFLELPPGGAEQRDVNNPKPSLRGRKLLGMPILTGFAADGDVWRGTIYDPRTGKTYRSILRRKDARTLEVKGCIGPFCQTQIWTRVD